MYRERFYEADLGYLTDTLDPALVVWQNLGLQLGIRPPDLYNIRDNYRLTGGEPRQCLREMLRLWLSSYDGKLSTLIAALQKPSVGENQLAAELRQHGPAYLEGRLV